MTKLVISQGERQFYVEHLTFSRCEALQLQLNEWLKLNHGAELPIWHDEQVVYQLGHYGSILSYDTQVIRLKRAGVSVGDDVYELLKYLWVTFWLFRVLFILKPDLSAFSRWG